MNDDHLLADSVDIGLILLDHDGRIRLWNRWIAQRATRAAHEAEGKLKSPLVVVQGRLYRRYERGRSFTLEMLDAVGVASVEAQRMGVGRLHPLLFGHGEASRFEERHAATDGTRL